MDIGHHRQEARVQFFASGARGVAIVGPNHRLIASGLDFLRSLETLQVNTRYEFYA